jgi:hypothetical protein
VTWCKEGNPGRGETCRLPEPRQPRVQLRLPAHARHARLHSSDMPVVARQVCGEFDVRDVWDRKSHGGGDVGGVDGAPRRERNTSADI